METTPFTKCSALKPILAAVFLISPFAARAGESATRVRALRVPGVSKIVKAQSGTDGVIHLLFAEVDGPHYANSRDGGATFSPPIPVLDAAARKPGLEFHAEDLAVGKDGRVHVAMSCNAWKLKLPQEEWSLHYATLAPDAKTFSPVRNLNRKPSEGFCLAADERGRVTAAFLSSKLFAMTSNDSGVTFGPWAELNPAWNPCDCCTTSATYGPDGKLALIYREETNHERDVYVVLWDQRSESKPARTRLSGVSWNVNACPMTYYSINRTDTGYVAAWPTKGQVYFAKLDQEGKVLPPGEIKTPGTNGMRTGILALSAADGTTLVAWKNKDVLGWQLYDAKGRPEGKPGSETSPGNGAAGVVLRDGRFLLFP
ncbi:MAG: hypothetical protein FJ398_18730 [Verrucomicrobia bacterium]|nr:hypothetical protein [Verrucomicrobiota bacterium]